MRYTKLSYEDALAILAESLDGNMALARRQILRLCEMDCNVVEVSRSEAPTLHLVTEAHGV